MRSVHGRMVECLFLTEEKHVLRHWTYSNTMLVTSGSSLLSEVHTRKTFRILYRPSTVNAGWIYLILKQRRHTEDGTVRFDDGFILWQMLPLFVFSPSLASLACVHPHQEKSHCLSVQRIRPRVTLGQQMSGGQKRSTTKAKRVT